MEELVPVGRAPTMAPQPPVFNGQPMDYPIWKAHFSKVLHLGKYVEDHDKSAVLLCALDITVQRTVMALISPTTLEDATYKEMIEALDNHYKVTPIPLAEYFKLFSARQSTGQSYPEYAVHLRALASSCTWPILLNRALAIIFVMGIQDDRLRQQLLQKDHATLDLALEQAKQFASIMKESSISSHRPTSSADLNSSVNQVRSQPRDKSGGFGPCDRCSGTNHRSSDCRYRNMVCNACEKVGHLEKACRSKKPPTQQKRAAQRKGKKKEERSTKVNQLVYQLDSIQLVSSNEAENDNRIYEAELQINGRPARLEVDTGAALTIVSTRLWQEIGSPTLKKSVTVCRSFTGHEVKVRGQADVDVDYNGKFARLMMLVTDTNQNLMGRPWIRALAIHDISKLYTPGGLQTDVNLVRDKSSIDHLLREFPSVFESGLGHCTKVKAHLELKENVRPTFIRPRPLPFAVYDSTTAEIDRLVTEGVVSAVDYSDWAAPIVVVAKPGGKIRLCADFSTGLNEALDLHKYPLPRPEELFQRLNGGKLFSKLDFSDAYLQVELDDDSKKLVVINTHKGLFRYNRLPFGVSSAPAIFQQVMERMLTGIPGVGVYLDDVIVTGANDESHDRRLQQVLRRIQEYGFRVRREKCEWAQESIEYLGFRIDASGRHTSEKKTKAIAEMPAPQNLSQLRSVLGLINHYARFLPSLSSRLAPLHRLLKKEDNGKFTPFEWTPECELTFTEVKKDLTSPLMLMHYDPQLPIILAADASSVGVGAVISHRLPDGREIPVAHASKTLTTTESRYPQIEKEALAIIFGVTKFQQYLWGRRFTLRTDHKPLVKIFGPKRGLPVTSVNRLQNYAITLMHYAFDIEYVRTEEFGQADGLSRLPQGEDATFDESRKIRRPNKGSTQ
uniref:RNA-directed DNA polymerase n=1 Tax=Plectus sambesii TaxID=2011161 RepID=A0A914VKS3_9BILA